MNRPWKPIRIDFYRSHQIEAKEGQIRQVVVIERRGLQVRMD